MPPSIERDPSYYLPTKIFLVDGILFQIHVDILARESEVFKDIMSLPVFPDGYAEGVCDENPIRLEGVFKDAFRQLLRVLYPSKAIGCAEVLSFSQWTLVLELADRYCMDSLRRHAISKMEHIQQVDPVDKLVLARRFNVSQWLLPSFTEILQRSNSLDHRAVDSLGVETVLRLVAIRDRMPWQSSRGYYGSQLELERPAITHINLTETIFEQFPECLRPIGTMNALVQ